MHEELVRIVRGVRHRWRLRVALRGLAILAVATLIALLLAALVDRVGLSPAGVLGARWTLGVLVLGVLVWALVLPLWRRPTDEQVALYLEEREPSLREAVISALAAGSAGASPALARRTVETALARCRAVEDGRRIERRSLQQSSGVLAGALGMGALLFLLGPGFVRSGARTVLLSAPAPTAAGVFRVAVAPGDTSIPRGADLEVAVLPGGFRPERVEIFVRAEGDSTFQRIPMVQHPDSARYEIRLFDVRQPTEYFVDAGAARSPVHRVKVLDVPYVDKLQLDLIFPAYTGLPPERMEDGGDIAVPAGTLVRVRATPTMPVAGGRVVLGKRGSVTLTPDPSGALIGQFGVTAPGEYHLELRPRSGNPVEGSPTYVIDVLPDAAPTISFSKPGRDAKATSIEEIFLEAQAQDDYGVRSLDLVYSVNGGPERTVPLHNGRGLRDLVAGHTLFLEEMGLRPGDIVSYYGRATDVGPGVRRPVTSDIYFLEIRPFGRDYRQADSGGQGGAGQGQGGGGGDDAASQLSRRQRELIAATFNLVRDRDRSAPQEFQANLQALADAQQKLREQALTLAQRLTNRGEASDSAFRVIAEALPQAAAEMERAVTELRATRPGDALPPEQRALQQLQRAEAVYREVQVRMGQQQQGGGSSGSQSGGPSAEDLADLFGLELDKLRNQYETVQRGGRQQAQEEVDQALDRVRELARRQERENERLRQAMANQRAQAGTGGDGQRRLAEETEAEARRLERLAREQRRPDLQETARRLQEAAAAMRRAAAGQRSGNPGEARAALDRLRQAGGQLDRNRASGLQGEAEDLRRRAERLANEQHEIQQEMQGLPAGGAERQERARRLVERKERQAGEVADMERQFNRLAAESRREQPNASRRLQAAAESIRRSELQERIRASRAGTQPGAPEEYVRRMEQGISSGLDEVSRLAQEARGAMTGGNQGNRSDENLERARNLVRGMESVQERTRQAGNRSTQSSRSQSQQQGQTGQQPGQQPGSQQGQGQSQGQQSSQQGGGQSAGEASESGGGNPNGGTGPRRGGNWGPNGGGGPRGLNPEDARQLRREVAERLQEAQELRRQLAREGRDVGGLDRAISDLRSLNGQRAYANLEELQHVQTALVDRLKQFEFQLRRTVQGEEQRKLFLSGSGDVPVGYRALVERYYRELSEGSRR